MSNLPANSIINKTPTPPEPKIHLIFKRDMTIDEVREFVAKDQKARIEFRDDCKLSGIPTSKVTLVNTELLGEDVKDFFERVIKPRADNKRFCVFEIQKDNSYEISCNPCNL